ncbi:MAG: hypothetical protein COB35_05125 [Gammaproteobacteria bacterium]|nr:MAG: hypothetical protein COB35_05125 [Gammaproteobacteria bacterium]
MKWTLLTILFTLYYSIPVLANEQLTLLTTEHYPPLNYIKNGKPAGPAVDIVKAIQKQLKSKTPVVVYPWKRAYITTTHKKNTAIFALARSKKRENLFKWVGPIATKKYAFYALNSTNIKLTSISDANNYSIGVQFGSVSEEYLQTQYFKSVQAVSTSMQNLNKLLNKRIELWYVDNANLVEQLKLMSIPMSKLKEVLIVKNEKLYIGFNKETPANIINLWQQAFQELYQQGIIKNIYQKHHLLTLYPKIQKINN